MKKISLVIIMLTFALATKVQGQMMEDFEKMSWEQKDSTIAMLFSAGMSTISHLMIDQAYENSKGVDSLDALSKAKFSNWQGLKSLSTNDYAGAERYLKETIELYRQSDEASIGDVRAAYVNLADAQESQNDTASMASLDMALQIMESQNAGEDALYLSLLQRAVENRMTFERYDEAEELSKDAVRIAKSAFTQKSDEYLNAFMTLGKVYERSGEYRKGSNLIMQAFQLSKNFLPADHPRRLSYYYEAIELQQRLGRTRQVAGIYQEANQLYEENESLKDDPTYAAFLDDMGSFYLDQDSIQKAAKYIEEANVLISLRAEKSSRSYIASQINMGNLLSKQDRSLEAETYYTDALQYVASAFGPNSTIQGDLHAAISDLYQKLGNEPKALDNQLIATEIYRQNFGNDDERFISQLAELGMTYATSNPDTAIHILENAYNSYLGKFDLGHPYLFKVAGQLSSVSRKAGLEEKAGEFAQLAATSLNRQLKYLAPLFNEEEARASRESYKPFLKELVDMLRETEDYRLSFEAHVIFATLQQMKASNHPTSIARTTREADEEFITRFRTYQQLTDELYELYNSDRSRQGDSKKTIDQLHGSVDSYAKALNATTAVSGVTKGVGTGGTFIEVFDGSEVIDEDVWLIFLYGGQGTQSQALVLDAAQPDCATLWKTIEPEIKPGNVNFILHSSSFQCAMESMLTSEGELVDDIYQVRYMRKVDRPTNFRLEPDKALLVGGFDYDDRVTPATDLKIGLNAIVADSMISRIGFNTLVGSDEEMAQINKTLAKKKWTVDRIGQGNIPGTKETFFKYAADNPALLHFSTFRYFFDPTWENKPTKDSLLSFSNTTTDPMLRASLILNEANAMTSRPKQGSSLPGFLTAREIAQLDLSNTRLVILSGLSEAISGEVGTDLSLLVDAFKQAGVHFIMYSRDGVGSEGKSIFLKDFFKNVHRDNTVLDSWKKTKEKLKKKYDPSVWAAFLLVG